MIELPALLLNFEQINNLVRQLPKLDLRGMVWPKLQICFRHRLHIQWLGYDEVVMLHKLILGDCVRKLRFGTLIRLRVEEAVSFVLFFSRVPFVGEIVPFACEGLMVAVYRGKREIALALWFFFGWEKVIAALAHELVGNEAACIASGETGIHHFKIQLKFIA